MGEAEIEAARCWCARPATASSSRRCERAASLPRRRAGKGRRAGFGPGPYDLLLAGLGACTSMTLRLYAEQKKLALKRVSVRLAHNKIHAQDCEHCETAEGLIDHIDRAITLEGDLDAAQRKRHWRSPTSARYTGHWSPRSTSGRSNGRRDASFLHFPLGGAQTCQRVGRGERLKSPHPARLSSLQRATLPLQRRVKEKLPFRRGKVSAACGRIPPRGNGCKFPLCPPPPHMR